MKAKKSTYITWVVIAIILIGGIALISQGKKSQEKALAEKYQDVKEEPLPTNSNNAEATPAQDGPYKTEGGNEQEDDNFFVKGSVDSLTSLVDKEKSATIVWVSASWCEICHAMRPFVWKSMNKYADKVAIKEIDIDDNKQIARDYQILGTPAFFVLDKNGTIVTRFSGATQSAFESQLEKASQLN